VKTETPTPKKRQAAPSRKSRKAAATRRPVHEPRGVFLPRLAAQSLEAVLADQLPVYAQNLDAADDESIRTVHTLSGALLQIREALA
jgi:hypothetical protein